MTSPDHRISQLERIIDTQRIQIKQLKNLTPKPSRAVRLSLTKATRSALYREAFLRGISASSLARQVVERVALEDLFKAVLDE